jgi:hypothetical protein
MKLPKFSIKDAKKFVPSFRTTVIILVVILLFVLVVVMRKGQTKESFVRNTPINFCKQWQNEKSGNQPNCTNKLNGVPTCKGSIVAFKPQSGQGNPMLWQYDGAKWVQWSKCKKSTLDGGLQPFEYNLGPGVGSSVPVGTGTGTGTDTAGTGTDTAGTGTDTAGTTTSSDVISPTVVADTAPTTAQDNTSVVSTTVQGEKTLIDLVVDLWDSFFGGTDNENAPNKFTSISSELIDKNVYLKWNSCTIPTQMYLTGYHTCALTSGYNYAFSEANKSKYVWKIIRRPSSTIFDLYTIANVDRSTRCTTSYFLSVHEECNNNTVTMKSYVANDNTILWATMSIPNRAGKYAFVSYHRILKKCSSIALSFKHSDNKCTGTLTLDTLKGGDAKAVEIALVTPLSTTTAIAAPAVVNPTAITFDPSTDVEKNLGKGVALKLKNCAQGGFLSCTNNCNESTRLDLHSYYGDNQLWIFEKYSESLPGTYTIENAGKRTAKCDARYLTVNLPCGEPHSVYLAKKDSLKSAWYVEKAKDSDEFIIYSAGRRNQTRDCSVLSLGASNACTYSGGAGSIKVAMTTNATMLHKWQIVQPTEDLKCNFEVFQHKDFGGKLHVYGCKLQKDGVAPVTDLIDQDSASSWKVPAGYVVQMFKGTNGTGDSAFFKEGNHSGQSGWNDNARSFAVYKKDQLGIISGLIGSNA